MKKNICFFVSLFLPIFILFAQDTLEEKTVSKINIEIIGDDSDPSVIKASLSTQEGHPFSQYTFDSDLKKLTKKYDRIDPEVITQDNQILINIKLWTKPLIEKIIWEGNDKIKTSTLQKELKIKTQTSFNRASFNKGINRVKQYYIKKGFFESRITYTVNRLSQENSAVITIHIEEGSSGKIGHISFKGFTKKETAEIKQTIYLSEYSIFYSWLTGTGLLNKDLLDRDHLSIVNYLQNKGYADAKVDVIVNKDKDRTNVEFVAHRGTLYRVGKISIEGYTLFSQDLIEKQLLIHTGDVFSPEKLRLSAQNIKDFYGRKGHIETQVLFDAFLHEGEPIYDIQFQIEESDRFRIGMIKIYGNSTTKSNVILRESLLVPGEIFDSRRLKATQTRLENIGYFKNVNVYAVRSSDISQNGENYRDVIIEVEETTTGHFSLFAGFSSLDDLSGGVDLTENNFNLRGVPKIFSEGLSSLRGGGEYVRVRAQFGTKQENYLISWMTPYLRDSLWRLGVEGTLTRSKLQAKAYKIKTYGFSIATSYPINNLWTYGMKYRLRDDRTDVTSSANEATEQLENNKGVISAFSAYFNFDSTDNPYKPRYGLRSNLEGEYAGIGGQFEFLKTAFINTLYHPIWPKATMKYRGNVKFIEPLGKRDKDLIPLAERFFLGGENSVRGYKPYILGPRVQGDNKTPLGGISSTLLSAELSQGIIPIVDIFAFFDAGSISLKHFRIPKLNTSYGVGARVEVMRRVPITFGIGFPINPDHKSDVQTYFFSMGGQF